MVMCIFCGSETVKGYIDEKKKERLVKNSPHLKNYEIHARFCNNCGHVTYSKKRLTH